ncbi:MAG: glycosyltransferase family 4 protein [Thermodesulfovibrionales bacterium]
MINRPLTIVNVVSYACMGGADRFALDLSIGLREKGHRVIWAAPASCQMNGEAREGNVEIFDLEPSHTGAFALAQLLKICKSEAVDIVNTHDSPARHLLLLARLRGLRSKIVFTRHCILSGLPYVGAFYFNLVDMNIAVSKVIKKSLLRGGILPGRAVMVYGGIDINKFRTVSAERVANVRNKYCRPGAFNIGIVARFNGGKHFRPDNPSMKGHEFLFRALSDFPGDFNVLVLGVWGGRDIDTLKLVAEYNGLSPAALTICDFQKDIAPFYKIMDLNVLPSRNEGLGLTLIEAMAAGVPCIGADSGGIREIIDDGANGFLFAPGDSNALAEKIRTLREDAEIRDRFIRNGKEKVARLFDIDNAVRETEKIFYGLVARSQYY